MFLRLLVLFLGVQVCVGWSFPNFDVTQVYNHPLESCTLADFMYYVPQGYPVEAHEVTTLDGFKLTLFRIQAKGTQIVNDGRPAVILQHGIDDSALAWVSNTETKSFAFILANAGYDVWLANNRGNRFSRTHSFLKPWEKAFWAFSFQQMAEYDVPANIQKVRQVAGVKKVTYFGHSQGTSQMFAALSDPLVSPKVAPFVESFHAFAPVVFLTQTKIKLFDLAKYILPTAELWINRLNIMHFGLGKCTFNPALIPKFQQECSQKVCDFGFMTDPDPYTMNYEANGWVANASPAGFSMQCIEHFAQLIDQNSANPAFKKYDYGSYQLNKKHYGQDFPPLYDLSRITNDVFLYYGQLDRLADATDAKKIAPHLKNAKVVEQEVSLWGHNAFIHAKKLDEFYGQVIKKLDARLGRSASN